MSKRSTVRFRSLLAGLGLAALAAGASAQTTRPAVQTEPPPTPGMKAIANHIRAHSQQGVFSIFDARERKPLALRLKSIHATSHAMDSGEVFYCADFTGLDGKEYDLDFYVKGEEPVIVDSFVHKADGKERIRPAENAEAVESARAELVRKALADHWKTPQEIADARQGKMLELTFVNVHETVKATDDGSFFACVDVRDAEGNLYDLDVFVRPTTAGFRVVETLIHKMNGVERLRQDK